MCRRRARTWATKTKAQKAEVDEAVAADDGPAEEREEKKKKISPWYHGGASVQLLLLVMAALRGCDEEGDEGAVYCPSRDTCPGIQVLCCPSG